MWTPRWRGQAGRLEVWYLTATDTATGSGLWLHHEHVAPTRTDGVAGGEPRTTAWVASFPVDGAPSWERTDAISLTPAGSSGSAGELSWDLRWDSRSQRPLYTFPRWAWHKELLPAAQIVAAPTLAVEGTVAGRRFSGPGAVSRIFGHGNAKRWAWLHCDLGGGDLGGGDVLELVSAVSMRPGLRSLPPITHLRMRLDGRDWPGFEGPAFGLRSQLALPEWTVAGRVGRTPVRIEVRQPADRCVAIDYADPDGATATCTNTERADVVVRVGDRTWKLNGTGHAEVGTRP